MSKIETVALASLVIAPENDRRRDPAKVEALAASIAIVGLIQPLSVYRDGEAVMVEAGGYRLEAMTLLASRKKLPKALKAGVPVNVQTGNAMARARSIAENEIRDPLHPVDRLFAYAAMFDEGMAPDKIAAACAVSAVEVRKLLRLKGVAAPILAACKAGDIDLEMLQAYSVTDDAAAQLAVWEGMQGRGSAYQVRDRLTAGALPAYTALAQFVGAEAYDAAGGRRVVDLFNHGDADAGDWLDRPLAERLAAEKLEAIAEGVRAEGWGEVILPDDPTRFWQGFDRMAPEPFEFGEGEEALADACDAVLEDDFSDEWEVLAADLIRAHFEARANAFTPAQMADGVAFVMIRGVERGWMRRKPVEVAPEADAPDAPLGGSQPPATAPAEVIDSSADHWTHGGHAGLTEVATAAVATALLANPAAAYDLAVADLAVKALHVRMGGGVVGLNWSGGCRRLPGEETALDKAATKWAAIIPASLTEALPVVAALKAKDKAELLALAMAESLEAREASFHHYDRRHAAWAELGVLARHLGTRVADHWTPSAGLLAKGSKRLLLAGLTACGVTRFREDDKRGDMAEALAREAAALRWVPPILADLTPVPEAAPEAVNDAEVETVNPLAIAAE